MRKSRAKNSIYYELSDTTWIGWQNLSEGKRPHWREGRAWFHYDQERFTARLEWAVGTHSAFTVGFRVGGKDYLSFYIRVPYLLWLSFHIGGHLFRRLSPKSWDGRDTSLSIHDGCVWFCLWHDEGIGNPRGFRCSLDFVDLLLGRAKFLKREVEATDAIVVLPERSYPVRVVLHEDTWKRSRWPWAKRIMRATVESEKGIPSHAGKGENAWDLDDDALFGMTMPAESIQEAVGHVAESILRDRERYGMPSGGAL